MIQGVVTADGVVTIPLLLRGPSGSETEVEAAIDTGFTGLLTLPQAMVARLGLHYDRDARWTLADGTALDLPRYAVEIDWFGGFRQVFALAVGDMPLVGTRLLAGGQLRAEFAPAGAVTLEPLP